MGILNFFKPKNRYGIILFNFLAEEYKYVKGRNVTDVIKSHLNHATGEGVILGFGLDDNSNWMFKINNGKIVRLEEIFI